MANRLPAFHRVLLDLCRASLLTADFEAAHTPAPACAQLIEEVAEQGREQFVLQHTQTPGPNEYCLNGDGLKLRYEVEYYREGDQTNVYVLNLRLSGKQVADYPAFVRAAEPILEAANESVK
jgi:hypothetical protein